jgi:hypothetical protein
MILLLIEHRNKPTYLCHTALPGLVLLLELSCSHTAFHCRATRSALGIIATFSCTHCQQRQHHCESADMHRLGVTSSIAHCWQGTGSCACATCCITSHKYITSTQSLQLKSRSCTLELLTGCACLCVQRPVAKAAAVQHCCSIHTFQVMTSKTCTGCSAASVSAELGLQRAKKVDDSKGSKQTQQVSCWLELEEVMLGMSPCGVKGAVRISLTSQKGFRVKPSSR